MTDTLLTNDAAAQADTQAAQGSQQAGAGATAPGNGSGNGASDGSQGTAGNDQQAGTQQAGDESQAGTDQQGQDAGNDTAATAPSGGYELKLPEKTLLNNAAVQSTAAIAQELGLNNEQAQKLLEHQSQAVTAYQQSQQQVWNNQTKAWRDAVAADPEIGGPHLEANVAHARAVINKYGSPAFVAALNETGLGNHPELVRFVVNIGKAAADDGTLVSGARGGAGQKTLADNLYPDMK